MSEEDIMRRLRGVDLNLFVVFATVMQERNVTRAADHLLMSQAAVSAALARLRKIFSDPLFVRAPGGIEPTIIATRLDEPIRQALGGLHMAVAGEPSFDPLSAQTVFKLGMSDDLEALLIPQLITKLAQESPGSSLRCLQANRTTITDMLENGLVSIGVVASDRWGADFRSRVVFESGYATVYAPDAMGRRGPLTIDEFVTYPQIMISADGRRGIVDDILEAAGLNRRRMVSTAHFAMVPFLLARTATIATMPRHVAEVFASQLDLEVFDPPIDFPRFTVSVLWHNSSAESPALSWMVDTICELTQATVSPAGHASPR